MTGERFIYVNRWDEFQHYKEQSRPPWIKTYTRLLHEDAYLQLTEHRALLLHRLWLEYATSGRRLLVDTASLSRRLHMKVTRLDLDSLNHAGFIRICSRATLEKLYSNSIPEVEVDKKRPLTLKSSRPETRNGGGEFKVPELLRDVGA